IVELEGVRGRHDGLNRRIAAGPTPALSHMCLTVHCQPGINFKSRFVAPSKRTTDLCLEIQRRYCTYDHKPGQKRPIDVTVKAVIYQYRLINLLVAHPKRFFGRAAPTRRRAAQRRFAGELGRSLSSNRFTPPAFGL